MTMEKVAEQVYVVFWTLFWKVFGGPYRGLLHIRCWFTGHDVCHVDAWTYEPDYCSKCYVDWPQEKITLLTLFNRGYCWMVEQNWAWFDQLDEWLSNHVSKRWWLSWWEY